MVPLVIDQTSLTRDYLLSSLINAINSTGGLHIVEEDVPLEVQEGVQITADDILLAIPKAQESFDQNEWIEISSDEQLLSIVFNDYDMLAFKYVEDADFFAVKPEYQEKE